MLGGYFSKQKKIKTMKKISILILFSIILCGIHCEIFVDHLYRIRIQNNSNDTIQFYESYNYPDTSLADTEPRLIMVFPSEYRFLDSKEDWNEVLVPPRDTLSIFILSKDTVDKYSWEEIRQTYNILKRYDLSLEDLKNSSWTVTYP